MKDSRVLSTISDEVTSFRLKSSVLIAGLMTFLVESSRGFFLSALWPLNERLGGDRVCLGYLVAVYFVGRLSMWTIFGKIGSRHGRKASLLVSAFLMTAGSLMWTSSLLIGGMCMLVGSMFVIGMGSGSMGVARAFIIGHTQLRNRVRVMNRLTALQYCAVTVVPVVGSVLIDAGELLSPFWSYTMPMFALAMLALTSFAALVYPFADPSPIYSFSSYNSHDQHHSRAHTVYHPVHFTHGRAHATGAAFQSGTCATSTMQSSTDHAEREGADDGSEESNGRLIARSMMFSTEADFVSVDGGVEEALLSMPSSRNSLCEIPLNDSVDENPQVARQTISQRLLSALLAQSKADAAIAPPVGPATLAPSSSDPQRKRIIWLTMALNFTMRGALAVMETQVAQTLLRQYNYSQLRLGVGLSIAGIMGTVQLLLFKHLWSSHFSDYELLVAGLFLLGMGQTLAITWGPDQDDKPVWRVVVAYYLVVAIAYPIANTAVLGVFTSLQRAERSKSHVRFAFMGMLARVICPIASGYFEVYVQAGASFGAVFVMIALSIMAVMILAPERILFLSASQRSDDQSTAGIRPSLVLKGVIIVGCVFGVVATIGAILNWT